MAAPTVANWQAALLGLLGAPVTPHTLAYLNAWQRAEGGTATNNPFNTTLPYANGSSYNSVGVRNYPTPQAGLQATARTLLNGRYGEIVKGLRTNAPPQVDAQALANSPWGTGSLVLKILGGSAPPPVQQQAQPGAPAATPSPAGAPAPGAQQVLAAALLKASRTGQYGGFFNTLAGLRQQAPPQAPPQAPTAPLAAAGPTRQPQPQPAQAPQQPAAQGPAPRLPALVHIQPDSTVTGVDKHLLRAVGELATYLGKPVTITSGYRSYQEQEALYQRYLAGGNIAAKPGQSNHERGEALDLTINGVPIALAVPASVLARFGLHNPVRGDYPHTTLLNVNG